MGETIVHYCGCDDEGSCDGESEWCCGGDGSCDAVESTPDCVDGLSHAWVGVGGCHSNPGVWSLGGTAYEYRAECRWCGIERHAVSHGWQRNPGECDSVSYDGAAVVTAEGRAELQRRRRNALARRRRAALAVAHYGSVTAWRVALKARRADILRRNCGARGAI